MQNMITRLQNVSNIPIITTVDEEGGGVVRISSNKLVTNERFQSPRTLYSKGGFALIEQDTIKKVIY